MNAFFKKRRKRGRMGKGREGLDGSLLAKVPKSYEHNQKCCNFLPCLHLSWGRDQVLRLPASREKLTPWQNLAQEGSGIAHIGLLTRMFTYRSQVILSPSGMF